jgi:hypothetical protein
LLKFLYVFFILCLKNSRRPMVVCMRGVGLSYWSIYTRQSPERLKLKKFGPLHIFLSIWKNAYFSATVRFFCGHCRIQQLFSTRAQCFLKNIVSPHGLSKTKKNIGITLHLKEYVNAFLVIKYISNPSSLLPVDL